VLLAVASAAGAQTVDSIQGTPRTPDSLSPQTVALTVPSGVPVQIALDKEVRVHKVGQLIHGRVAQPVYAFDRLVIPVGTGVTGRIAKIGDVPGKKRTLAILNGDFTPARKIEVEFNDLVLPDGRHMTLHTAVTPDSGRVMKFADDQDTKKKSGVTDAASKKIQETKEEERAKLRNAFRQIKAPGKAHRLKRYALNQLPVRPQYLDTGILYMGELRQPLEFGSEPLTAKQAASIGTPPPPGSVLHALLITPLDSAKTKKGAEVEAVISQPVFDGDHLLLPQGSHLEGSVVEVQPARSLHHNGELRIVFHQLLPPKGIEQPAAGQSVVATLHDVQGAKDAHVEVDSEGGAQAATPKTRYLSTGIALALAATSLQTHARDADDVGNGATVSGRNSMAAGDTAFRLVGVALGLIVHSQPIAMAMGAYGAGLSIYSHFISRGQDVVFPKNTVMEIVTGRSRTPAALRTGTGTAHADATKEEPPAHALSSASVKNPPSDTAQSDLGPVKVEGSDQAVPADAGEPAVLAKPPVSGAPKAEGLRQSLPPVPQLNP